MPIKSCKKNGKPGFKWGNKGTCYTYTPGNEESLKRAKEKAKKQGRAIHSEDKEDETEDNYRM